MNIVELKDIYKIYGEKTENQVVALNGINLDIEKGKFYAIVGTSGSGKSTLLHILGGLDCASKGIVQYNNEYGTVNLTELNKNELTLFRRKHIGFIFQNYNLIPILTAYENIIFSLQLDGREIDVKFTEQVMEKLNIKEKRDFYPNQLSGGQQQRIAIARAVVMQPALILADEPTGNLDCDNSNQVIKMLRETVNEFKQTVIMVTHDEQQVSKCDAIIHIEDGIIQETRLNEI